MCKRTFFMCERHRPNLIINVYILVLINDRYALKFRSLYFSKWVSNFFFKILQNISINNSTINHFSDQSSFTKDKFKRFNIIKQQKWAILQINWQNLDFHKSIYPNQRLIPALFADLAHFFSRIFNYLDILRENQTFMLYFIKF